MEQIDISLTTATHLDYLMTENLSKKLTVEMVVEAGLSKKRIKFVGAIETEN